MLTYLLQPNIFTAYPFTKNIQLKIHPLSGINQIEINKLQDTVGNTIQKEIVRLNRGVLVHLSRNFINSIELCFTHFSPCLHMCGPGHSFPRMFATPNISIFTQPQKSKSSSLGRYLKCPPKFNIFKFIIFNNHSFVQLGPSSKHKL